MANTRNPTWQRDELILALDLYFRCPPTKCSKESKEVIQLSELLNRLPIHGVKSEGNKFRNPNGVYMKLCNFLRFDPSYPGKGLRAGGKEEESVWYEFSSDHALLRKTAAAIAQGSHTTVGRLQDENDSDELSFPEGKILYRIHRTRERNVKLVRKAKELAMKTGLLSCQVCNFNFENEYGDIGKGFIECHHTVPVSEYQSKQETKLKDLSLVCSNCHKMLHRRRPWLSVHELSELIKGRK
jgi:5-methylcytosine-specific restriction protein A